jgi:hypothetical protein
MKYSEYVKEFLQLEKDAKLLNERSTLQLESATFLRNEAAKLSSVDDSNMDWKEKEEYLKKLESMLKRLDVEFKLMAVDAPRQKAIELRLKEMIQYRHMNQFEPE